MRQLSLFLIGVLFALPVLSASPSPLELRIAQTLATNGLITEYKDNANLYRLNNTITRAEVVGLALKVAKVTLPDSYYCRDYFRDVRYNPKNNWICRAMEMAADRGYISKSNTTARPNDMITRAEALAIILKAGGYTIPGNTGENWQSAVVDEGVVNGVISDASSFGANADATRIDVFGMVYNMLYADGDTVGKYGEQPTYNSAVEKNADAIQIKIGKPGEVVTPPMNSATEIAPPTVTAGPFARFVVTAPKTVKTHVPFSITIQTVDANGLPVTNFSKKVFIDVTTGELGDFFLPVGEDGIGFYPDATGSFTLKGVVANNPGSFELEIYDMEPSSTACMSGNFCSSKTTASNKFSITATDSFVPTNTANITTQLGDFVITAPKDVTVNVPFTVEVTAVNPAGKNLTGYMGKIYFGERDSNSNLSILVPKLSYVFATADHGKKTFTNQFIAKKPGGYELVVYEMDTIPNGLWESVQIMAK